MNITPGYEIPVLDHGFVRYIDHMGSDQRIVEAARISYKSPGKGEEADKKLLHYLWKNAHSSPFEFPKITLNMKMPIFVMRQYIRHRTQAVGEVSARYTELPDEFYWPTRWRRQDVKNKQGSVGGDDFNPNLLDESQVFGTTGEDVIITADMALRHHCGVSYDLYKAMMEAGIAREMARMVLPLNIYTEFYAVWDLKNLLHFVKLREDAHAQAEIQEYGRAIKAILVELFPWTMEAYEKFKFVLKEVE